MPDDEPMAAVRGDEGAILLIVLFVTTVLAVLIGVVLTSVEVNLRNSTVADNIDDKTYAADGGVENTIQRLRQDPNACSDPNLSPWLQNDTTVAVSCTSVPDSAPFGSGWAVVTTNAESRAASLLTLGSTGVDIHGPVYVTGGIDLSSDLTVRAGSLVQNSTPSCPKKSGSGTLVTAPECTTMGIPGAAPPLPCIDAATCAPGALYNLPPRGPQQAYTTVDPVDGECRYFLPGKYTGPAPLQLGAENYFASGIYYFENVNIVVDGIDVIGGKRGASEMALVAQPPACAGGDNDAGVSDGSGVEWILGGTSTISVSSASGTNFELYSRQPGGSALEGAAGVSIRSVPATGNGFQATPLGTDIFTMSGGPGPQVAVHGLVYTPNADVTVSASDSARSEFSGGVVASTVTLRPIPGRFPGPAGMISVQPPADDHRFFTIKSVASGGGTSKDVTTTAVIELSNDAGRSVVIDSWVTNAA